MSAAGRRNPQHFHRLCTGLVPFCTSDPQAYAHTAGQAVLLPGWQPAADQCAGACVTCPPCRTPGPGVDGIAAWTGSRKKAPMLAAALQDRRPVYPPAACRSCSSCVAVRPGAPAGHCPACGYPSHELERDAATPLNARFRSRSGTPPVPGHDCGPSRWRISGGCGVLWRCQPGHSGRAESGKAPPCMRWRGPARPRRTGWPVAWPCWRSAPPAGARHPREAPVSRLLPRSRGRPQVMPVSER